MPRYAVMQRYASTDYGPWDEGSTIILDADQAEWVNRDSPGALAEIDPSVKLVKGQPVPESALKRSKPAEAESAPSATAAEAPAPKQELLDEHNKALRRPRKG